MSNWLPAGSEPAGWYYDPSVLNGTDKALTGTSTGHFSVPAMPWTIPDGKSKWAVPYDVEIDAALIKGIGMYDMEWNGSPVPAGWRHAVWISDSPGGSPIKILLDSDVVYGDQTNWWWTAPFGYPTLMKFVVPSGVYYICHELRDDSGTPVGSGTLTINQRRIGVNAAIDPADYTNWTSAYGGTGGGFGLPADKGYYYPKPNDADPLNLWENSTTKELLGTTANPDYYSGNDAGFYRRNFPMTKAHWSIPVTIGVEAAYVGASTLAGFDVNGSRYSGRVVFWWSDEPFSITRKKILGPDGQVKTDTYWFNDAGSYAYSDAILPSGTYYCNVALVGDGEGPDGTILTVDSSQTISAVIDHRAKYNKEVRPSSYANWNVAYGSGLPDAEPPPATTPPPPDPEPPQPPPTTEPPSTVGPPDDGGTAPPEQEPPAAGDNGVALPIQRGFRGLTNFWDSVKITKDPKKKHIEVSFVNAGGAKVGSDGPNHPDSTTPEGAPCLLWTDSYLSDGWEITDPVGKFFLTSTAAQILEANPYTVPVNIDVYDDSFDKLTLEWTDANGTHTKRVNVIREPDVTPYVEDVIEFYVSDTQAGAIEGSLGVHQVGSVAIVEEYTECVTQAWFGYYDAGDPCGRQYSSLPAVGDRPVYLSVSGCFLPPPEQDPNPSDGDDVPPTTTPPECLPQDCSVVANFQNGGGQLYKLTDDASQEYATQPSEYYKQMYPDGSSLSNAYSVCRIQDIDGALIDYYTYSTDGYSSGIPYTTLSPSLYAQCTAEAYLKALSNNRIQPKEYIDGSALGSYMLPPQQTYIIPSTSQACPVGTYAEVSGSGSWSGSAVLLVNSPASFGAATNVGIQNFAINYPVVGATTGVVTGSTSMAFTGPRLQLYDNGATTGVRVFSQDDPNGVSGAYTDTGIQIPADRPVLVEWSVQFWWGKGDVLPDGRFAYRTTVLVSYTIDGNQIGSKTVTNNGSYFDTSVSVLTYLAASSAAVTGGGVTSTLPAFDTFGYILALGDSAVDSDLLSADSIYDYMRSFATYTPPTYCERLP